MTGSSTPADFFDVGIDEDVHSGELSAASFDHPACFIGFALHRSRYICCKERQALRTSIMNSEN